ncbi:MAG: DUF2357 domain-containing protein [Clostridia bacterium]|nr:DUF2357 domain-containing protein [Clostridia bacterium]
MSNEKVAELYGEYESIMTSLVDSDEYYRHFMEAIAAGENKFSLFNRYFEKKIDLRWVDAIEKCIIPLDTIIRNPRKFIVQEEEIVPIERAKKITAESVRHLAQHTSMIARVEGDRVTPSKILNVFREESFEIYENRFIFTLLRNLQRFIDQRYNVLFGMANDESMSSLKMESFVNNGNEKINYKLEISTQAVEEHLEGDIEDTKNATALQRIERIKRIVNEFAHSAFMRDLQNCTPVRPPIMRTNVISKDVNFRACLELWQFISAYNEVGYEIISNETDEMVSDSYRDDLYRLFTANYMLLKNNVVSPYEVTGKIRKRVIKPKMLKRLAEELVMDYDMNEADIRKVFVDELKRVSKKKIAGEEKIKAAIARALSAEDARKAEIEAKIKAEIQRQKDIEKRKKEREAAKIAREKALEKERIAKEKARVKAKKEREIAMQKEKARKEKERARIAKEKAIAAEKAAKEKERQRLEKEKARKAKLLALEEEKKRKEALKKQLEKERIAKQKALEAEKAKAAREKQREKERQARQLALQKEKEKAAAQRQAERERAAKQKALQAEKEKIAKEKQREKERLAKQKALEAEKARAAAAREKEKERAAKQKALQAEKDRIAKEKQREKERLAKQKALEAEKARAAAAREKEKERAAKQREAQKEKERIAREKQKEKERLAREKLAQAEKERAAAAKAKEKERAAKQKAQQAEKEKLAKQKAKTAENKTNSSDNP